MDEAIVQENSAKDTSVELTPSMLSNIVDELKEVLEHQPATQDKEQKKALREKKKQVRELEGYRDKLMEYTMRLVGDILKEDTIKKGHIALVDLDEKLLRETEEAVKELVAFSEMCIRDRLR